jgi:hypothetical protein
MATYREDARYQELGRQLERLERQGPTLQTAMEASEADVAAAEIALEEAERGRLIGHVSERELRNARAAAQSARELLAAARDAVTQNEREQIRYAEAQETVKTSLQKQNTRALLETLRTAVAEADRHMTAADLAFRKAEQAAGRVEAELDALDGSARSILGCPLDVLRLAREWPELRDEGEQGGKRHAWNAELQALGIAGGTGS